MLLDLNCDLGEGAPNDAELMPLITSANVACGTHAGDLATARAALRLAAAHRVHVGAHPGYPDPEHYGRRELALSEPEVLALCLAQLEALSTLALEEGVTLDYVKPHGALYNQACRDDAFARPVVAAAERFALKLVGLPGSRLEALSLGRCPFIPEGFADRRYRPDGSLTPRSQPDAFVTDPAEAVQQAWHLVAAGRIRTLCVHGDNAQALAFVRSLRSSLTAQAVTLAPF